MARLYQFIITKKSFEDFLSQSPDGLSPTIHKGFLSVTRGKSYLYNMNFTVTHPLKLKSHKNVIAYCKYPNNTKESVIFYVPEQ